MIYDKPKDSVDNSFARVSAPRQPEARQIHLSINHMTTSPKTWQLGLTGGMGCGKSTVAALFEEHGYRTILTDNIVRELLATHAPVRDALEQRWGRAVFHEDGQINRAALAERVFGDPEHLQWLETLLHPHVREHWQNMLKSHSHENWIVEIPLLFEKSLEKHFDKTICVTCSMQTIMARLEQKGFTPDQIKQRMARQLPLEEKEHRADFVLSNDGTLDFLRQQVTALITTLTPS